MFGKLLSNKILLKSFLDQIDSPLIYFSDNKITEIINRCALNLFQLDSLSSNNLNLCDFFNKKQYALSKLFDNNDEATSSLEETYVINNKPYTVLWKIIRFSNFDQGFTGGLLIGYEQGHASQVSQQLQSDDVSDLKHIKNQLAIAERSSKAKSEFIENMSHDIRVPITGMTGVLQKLFNITEETKKLLDESSSLQNDQKTVLALSKLMSTVDHDGKYLLQSTEALLHLCDDVLEIARLDSNRFSQHIENFSLSKLIQHNIELLKPVAECKQIEFSCEIDSHIPSCLNGLRFYLDRILFNLMSNALKFTKNGYVKISAGLPVPNHGRYAVGDLIEVKIIVEDTGIGIPKNKFATIFENFTQLSSPYEGPYKGSGLGLYTVKRYLDAMKASISVDSTIKKGTRFTTVFPLTVSDHIDEVKNAYGLLEPVSHANKNEHYYRKKQSVLSKDNKQCSILVVEDDRLASMAIGLLLKKLKVNFEVVGTGFKALEKIEKNNYHLVLMDIGLPDLSGIEVAGKIRKLSDTKKSMIPIIALTGHAEDSVQSQQGLESGTIQGMIIKPAKLVDLESILTKYIQMPDKNKTLEPSNQISNWSLDLSLSEEDIKLAGNLLEIFSKDLKNFKKIMRPLYVSDDFKLLSAEVHRVLGGVRYLKLPQLEKNLDVLHDLLKEPKPNKKKIEAVCDQLDQSIDAFEAEYKNMNK